MKIEITDMKNGITVRKDDGENWVFYTWEDFSKELREWMHEAALF